MMKLTKSSVPAHTLCRRAAQLAATVVFAAAAAFAQAPQARITSAIDNTSRFPLPGSLSPRALPANDAGAMSPSTKLQGITLVFSRTAAQQAALDALIAAQQDPTSPQYHQWLTPAQFGAQFGAAASDIAAVQAWLQQQGFTLNGVSNSRDRITFTGTEAQVESAFGTQIHYFKSTLGTHFFPASELSVPAALASSVLAVTNLSDFRPHSNVKLHAPEPKPNFTSGQTGNYFLDPDDVAAVYDITAAYNAGYNGSGQAIAIIGQSAVVPGDIANFQSALGLTPKAPTQILVPNSGVANISSGDEAESDLDLEYSGAIAKGATIYFVYTGNGANYNVFNSLQYAVDNKIAPIVSSSYGDCEIDLGQSNFTQLNAILAQAATQGQSVISAAGDSGSTDCYGDTFVSTASQQSLAADFPASSQYVTAMGGTEFPIVDVTAPNSTYWSVSAGADILASAKGYIPEQVWNDDSAASGLSSGGGGVSIFAPRPTWQTGVVGITAGSFRLLPDISLAASPNYPGYLYCSSDTQTNVSGSCTHGFRDVNNTYLTVAGGTSFDAPQFAGMLAIINQAKGYTAGQGLVNPTLYSLASNATTYASAFHDIVTGGNECAAGASICTTTGASAYFATTGYDEASGLGSLDLFNLITAWPVSSTTSGLAATTTTITAATNSPNVNVNDVLTITVAPAGTSTVTPTGAVSLTINGTVVNAALPLTNGVATYTFSSAVSGSDPISATYSGNTIYLTSTGSSAVCVGCPGFTVAISPIALSVTAGSSVTATITVTPSNGYTGTVDLSLSGSSLLLNSNASCVGGSPTINVPAGGSPVSETVTFYTSEQTCVSLGLATGTGTIGRITGATNKAAIDHAPTPSPRTPFPAAPVSLAFAGLLAAGGFYRRSRVLRGALALGALLLLGFTGLTGCSSTSTAASSANAAITVPAGTYNMTLIGTDSLNAALTNSTNFTVTVH